MKPILWRTLQLGLGALALAVLVSYALPRTFRLERSIPISAPPAAVFPLLAELSAWKRWQGWAERDPAVVLSYSTAGSGAGAWTAWRSPAGDDGRATITALPAPGQVEYRLELPARGVVAQGSFAVAPMPGGCAVRATLVGDLGYNPVARWTGWFLAGVIGPDLESGLRNLKRLAESTPS